VCIYIAQSRYFKGVMHEHKKSFLRSVNAILGKVGRIASDEVILQLVFSKSIPVLLYGLESLPLTIGLTRDHWTLPSTVL